MQQLIPQRILNAYKVLFLAVPAIDEWHLTKVDFTSLPKFSLLNASIRPDYIKPVAFYEDDESALLVMDKINNHSLYSLMITQAGKTPKKGFDELSVFEMQTLFSIYVHFISWCNEHGMHAKGLLPRFSYNHDPDTKGRASLQSIERFHAHLYLLDQEEILKTPVLLLKDLHHSDYKDYFDPAAYCLERILVDLHSQVVLPKELKLIDESLIDKVRCGRGLGLNIVYQGPATYFKTHIFINYIRSLHILGKRMFSQLLPYQSLCYSFSIDLLAQDEYILNFYPRLFSTIGGAGVFASSGCNAIVIDRNQNSYFISSQVEKRRAFQNAFLHRLRSTQ